MVRKYRVSRPILVTMLAAAVAAGMSGQAGPAAASPAGSPYMLGPEIKVSTASTLTGCSAGASADFGSAYDNTEVEPQVAVNPMKPSEITGASQQTVGLMAGLEG